MNETIYKIQNILSSFLGEPKNDCSDNGQLQFGCPKCIEEKGNNHANKYNLEVNILKGQVFNCWCCSSEHDEMHGSITKLIKLYGNNEILKEYLSAIEELRVSEYYKLGCDRGEYSINSSSIEKEEVKLPPNYKSLTHENFSNKKALDYLFKRGIEWDIINEYHIGYTVYDENHKSESSRIILPSFNEFGELNYWTGRDYTSLPNRQKYFNPKVERKDLIFNEDKIQWDSDITLVEGPFDHIVVPNSIPLLGKKLNTDYKIYKELVHRCNSNINIWLDGDAYNDVIEIYKLLNHNRLYGKIRFVPVNKDMDPSKLYEIGGNKAIISHLKNAYKIKDIYIN